MEKNPSSKPNYFKQIEALNAAGALPQVASVAVAHDDWCRIFKGGACNCQPTIQVQNLAARPNRAARRQKR